MRNSRDLYRDGHGFRDTWTKPATREAKTMKIFVYGTLKKGHGNNRLLKDAEFIGKAVTLGKFKLAGFGVPFVWPDVEGKPLQGELYDIGDPTVMPGKLRLQLLDDLESNGHVYERRTHEVALMPSDPERGAAIHEAWIYEAMPHIQKRFHDREYCEADARHVNEAGYYEWRSHSLARQ